MTDEEWKARVLEISRGLKAARKALQDEPIPLRFLELLEPPDPPRTPAMIKRLKSVSRV